MCRICVERCSSTKLILRNFWIVGYLIGIIGVVYPHFLYSRALGKHQALPLLKNLKEPPTFMVYQLSHDPKLSSKSANNKQKKILVVTYDLKMFQTLMPKWIHLWMKYSVHQGYQTGLHWQTSERYNFPPLLLVSKGNCSWMYLCRKVTCELDQWLNTHIHTWKDGNPLHPSG